MNSTENSKTKISSDAWRLANPLLHLCPLVTGLLALCAPADVLDRASWLGAWCASLIARFPFLGGHAGASAYPQVTTLVMCVSWVLIIPSICLVWAVLWPYRHRALERVQLGASKLPEKKLALYAAAGFLLVVYSFWFLAGDPSSCKGCTTANRFSFAALMYGALITISFLPWFVVTVFYLHQHLKFSTDK